MNSRQSPKSKAGRVCGRKQPGINHVTHQRMRGKRDSKEKKLERRAYGGRETERGE